jgi:flagellar motor switch/type III secretory pathway protein FliN
MFFGSNKKIVARIDNLYKLYENLQNFDELYKKIMESYQSSKALIQEQVLNYDKKIIQQNTLVETTLVEFKVKLDKSIKEAIEEAKYSLEENKKSFEQYRSDLKSQLEKVFQDYRSMTEKSTFQSQNIIDSKISSFTSEQNNALKNQIETIKKDVQMVLGQYELNLTNLMGKAFQNEIKWSSSH